MMSVRPWPRVAAIDPPLIASRYRRPSASSTQTPWPRMMTGYRRSSSSGSTRVPALSTIERRLPLGRRRHEPGIRLCLAVGGTLSCCPVAGLNDIFEGWKKDGIEWVRFELPDMHGTSRSKTFPLRHALGYAERGLNMYGGTSVLDSRSDVVGGTLYHEERKYADQLLFPHPDTAAIVPWADRTARLICDARWYDGTPLDATPRQVYRRVLERCRAMGYEPVTGFEYEFYLLTPETLEPLFSGYHIFNTVRNAYVPTIGRILELMPQIGVDIITSNCEYAGSQWEINFAPGTGLAGPDQAFTFKNGVKEIARNDGYLATFMSKPFGDSAGSGCHTHISLVDAKSGDNAFGDAADAQGINDVCRS